MAHLESCDNEMLSARNYFNSSGNSINLYAQPVYLVCKALRFSFRLSNLINGIKITEQTVRPKPQGKLLSEMGIVNK